MTLTVEIPDVRVDEIRAFAQARGQGLSDFVVSSALAVIDDREADTEPDLDSVIEEAGNLYDRGIRGIPLDEAFADIRRNFAAHVDTCVPLTISRTATPSPQ